MRVALLLGTLLLGLVGCAPSEGSAIGLVTDIESEGIGRVRGFTLRNEDGRTLRFVIEGGTDLSGGGMPADHLREHMTTVTGVAVAFRTEGERRIAIKLTDATDLGQ